LDLSLFANVIVVLVDKQSPDTILAKFSRETLTGYDPIYIVDSKQYYIILSSTQTSLVESGQGELRLKVEETKQPNEHYPNNKAISKGVCDLPIFVKCKTE
jgi:hypothetical protein